MLDQLYLGLTFFLFVPASSRQLFKVSR